jgi:flagellar basal-body rod modification protein FlgD
MSTISSVSPGANVTTAADLAPTASRIPQKTLGQDDFMRLLAVQYQMQDPMKPMEDTAFIAQTAQFAALEQSTALGRQFAELRADQQRASANSYLGLRVTVDGGGGEIVSGFVSAVATEAGEPRLVVGDRQFALGAVRLTDRTGVTPASSSLFLS